MVINNDVGEVSIIKTWLQRDMRLPWVMSHHLNVEDAKNHIEQVHLIILKPEMHEGFSPEDIYKKIDKLVFEIPILVLTNETDKHGLSTFVMEQGAADIIIRGQFSRLVDAIEFALIRQRNVTNSRQSSENTLRKSEKRAETKYNKICDERQKEQEESKNTLSMFMSGYSVSDNDSLGKKKTK